MGTVALGGISNAIEHAVFASIASARVKANEQGKLFTLFHVVRALGAIVGAQTLCKRSFNAKWQGLRAGTGFYICGVIHVCAFIYIIWIYVARVTDQDES